MVRWGYKPTNLQQTGLPLKKKNGSPSDTMPPFNVASPGMNCSWPYIVLSRPRPTAKVSFTTFMA